LYVGILPHSIVDAIPWLMFSVMTCKQTQKEADQENWGSNAIVS